LTEYRRVTDRQTDRRTQLLSISRVSTLTHDKKGGGNCPGELSGGYVQGNVRILPHPSPWPSCFSQII